MKIHAAFVKAQSQFGAALKTSTNPHFRSRYADLYACIEAVIDALNANGIALMQQTHECESGVTVETVFIHESGETFSSGKLHVPASKQDPQGYGSALTYARRYSLMAACGIAPEDDDGNSARMKEKGVYDWVTHINNAKDLDMLKTVFTSACNVAKAGGDTNALEQFTKAKDARKLELTKDSK
jgi:hypothetical protein